MDFKNILHILLWSILIMETQEELKKTDETIFVKDYCDVKCDNKTHTMCPIEDRKPVCNDFELHRFDSAKYEDQIRVLIYGHNGVRNRIAERMQVPDMLELTWDRKLALMAENFLHRCEDRITDPCTLIPNILTEKDSINEFYKFNISETFIVQNMFWEKSHFYPFKFLERVIRSWYFEKDGMREPITFDTPDFKVKRLMGENNFTHFAYPLSYRFGCAMAQFKGAFHILCNYYPFFRTSTNTMYFQTGQPTQSCPARFPLRDEMFNNLCTDDSSNFFEENNDTDSGNILKCVNFLNVLILEFIVLYNFCLNL